jgi:hypothetical protein
MSALDQPFVVETVRSSLALTDQNISDAKGRAADQENIKSPAIQSQAEAEAPDGSTTFSQSNPPVV